MLQEFGAYDGLEVVDESKWGEARRSGHWLHTEVWPRYPREDWPADPAGYQFYLGEWFFFVFKALLLSAGGRILYGAVYEGVPSAVLLGQIL
jgi:hypothetical protein